MARRIRAREVLRLRSVNGLSQNAIARTAHVSKHSVQDVLEAARERGVSWEDVEGMSEEAAYALLFPGRGDAGPVHADPDWARVDWQHLFGRFREGQPRLPELDRRHVAQRRVDPEVVVPVHVVRELGP